MEDSWTIAKIVLLVALAIVLIITIYFLFVKRETQIYKSQQEINEFMKNWIKTQGVVKIFSRDLSWVDEEIIGILQSKGSDLWLYVEKNNEVIDKIKMINDECKITFYGEIGFEPNSRFTIIHANKDEKQIAIALKGYKGYRKLEHEIYIYLRIVLLIKK